MQRAITVRLPDDVYEQLRREAFERHVSQASIITEALRAHFKGGEIKVTVGGAAGYNSPEFIRYLQSVTREAIERTTQQWKRDHGE